MVLVGNYDIAAYGKGGGGGEQTELWTSGLILVSVKKKTHVSINMFKQFLSVSG